MRAERSIRAAGERRTARAGEGKVVANFTLPKSEGTPFRVSRKIATRLVNLDSRFVARAFRFWIFAPPAEIGRADSKAFGRGCQIFLFFDADDFAAEISRIGHFINQFKVR